jgi:CPA2 family monovalent cation:H+ antiporter-2
MVDLWVILSDIVILLGASLVLGALISRLGQSPLVGYLIAGMILGGPGSIHAVESTAEINAIAELGVALLLFSLGLEFSVNRLWHLGARTLLAGVFQVVITTIIAALCARLFALAWRESFAVGIMVSLSSTAVVLRLLTERGVMEMPHGRNSLAVLLVQDLAVVPLAILMALLGGSGQAADALAQVGKLVVLAALLIVAMYLLNLLAVRALGTLTLLRNRELTAIFAVVTGLGSAWAAHAAGVSPALGAFVAGMFLGSSAFATQIRADISSLRVVLLTLFFGAAGMVADPLWILTNWYLVAGVILLLTVGKLMIIWCIFQLSGHTPRVASATGLCLAQIGEFAFVLGSIGRNQGVVSEDLFSLVVSVTIVSFILSAWLVPLAPRFGNFVATFWTTRPSDEHRAELPDQAPHVVLIGFGPAGQVAARPFVDQDQRVVVLDLNREGVRRAQQLGFTGEVGDATQREVLEHLRISQAEAVVITVPHYESARTILEHVRQQAPHAHVVVRSRYQRHTNDFVQAGAHVVVGDEEQVGDRLAHYLRQWLQRHEDRDSDDGYYNPT